MSNSQTYRTRIVEIAKRPGCDQVFGVKRHRFELTLHSPDEIALLEEQLGVRLPEDYAQVLMETGSGAGPYYGLFAPGKILAEIDLWNGIARKEGGAETSPSAPFPFRQSDADEICTREKNDKRSVGGRATWPSGGCFPISCQGCSGISVLVATGEQRGKVWSVDTDGLPLAGWWPDARPSGMLSDVRLMSGRVVKGFQTRRLPLPPRPPTFLQWYESWLERVEIDLDDYAEYKARADLR